MKKLNQKIHSTLLVIGALAGIITGKTLAFETYEPYISEEAAAGYFPLAQKERLADVVVDTNDFKVAQIATADLVSDIERVTGRKPALKKSTDTLSEQVVLVGTLGRSPVIDRLVKENKLEVKDIQGQWESFVIVAVSDPLPGVKQALVIVGSDRRGTAYGVYELAKRIGVSPWYWWADVTPLHRAALYVSNERLRVGPPAVKYRGIFINDEMWGLRPWAMKTYAPEEGHGLGPRTHAKIFELLLRLRANHLWPAMHNGDGGTIPFNCYEQNKTVADDYAIVMGSSHIEPMLRNNISGAEWDREYPGEPWDYTVNKEHIYKYWEDRVKANGKYENVYTMGKRGKDDEPGKEITVPILEQIIADQRTILKKWADQEITRVPQVLIAYTEVLNLYNKGLKLPEDIIFCWPDDNFGYIRQLPDELEQKRSGGSGVYYHIQWLNGATTAYPWLNTTPPALIWEEMNKAFQYGADKLWVLNVGDIKPGEIGMEFFLEMACDPSRYHHENVREFLVRWAARDIDPRFAEETASIMEAYYRLGLARRPEHLVQAKGKNPLIYSWFSHTNANDEAMQRVEAYASLAQRAQAVYDQVPMFRKDAFFQFVLYPVQCASLINAKVIFADKSLRYGNEGRSSAGEYAAKARAAAARIIELTDHYNTGLLTASNKWKHIMSPAPGPWGTQFRQFEMPPLSDYEGKGPPALFLALEGGDAQTLADLSVYTQGKRFIDLFNIGKGEIRWTATSSQPWVRLDHTNGTFKTEQRVWVSMDWDKVPQEGALTAMLEIKSSAGNRQVTIPLFKPVTPARETITGYVESHGYVSIEAEHFTRSNRRGGAAWEVIKGLGRSGDSVAVLPAHVASVTEPAEITQKSPSLEYPLYLFSSGSAQLTFDCLPTKAVHPKQGVRLAYSLDDGEPQIVNGQGGDVLSNLRRLTATVTVATPGQHTLKVWMVDPGIVLDKLVLSFVPLKESYLGPPESYHR
jgi:Glycosyl hydrolase family 115/Gylcosyl hydrolase family 115 C-terminal domain/Glycosyl hydrolase family 67 N-terminus